MKKKTLIASLCAAVVVVAMLAIALWASHRPNEATCTSFCVEVTDSIDRRYVDSGELRRVLYREGLLPVGKKMVSVSCQAIEDCLLQHDMVRTAECYKLVKGGVLVRVQQRVPVLQVKTAEGSYYVDNERKVMPVRAGMQVDVPVFKGAVGERAATQEYYDFAQWLVEHRYWHNRIQYIQVHNTRHIVLKQRDDMGNVVLGDLTDYADKMQRLQKLYTKGLNQIEHPVYREYDLRYEGQVVARK